MKKKLKEVLKTKTEDGKDLTLDIRYPTSRNYQDAQILYSAEWTKLVDPEVVDPKNPPVKVKTQKQINAMLEKNGIWTKEDKEKQEVLAKEIVELGKQLKQGKTDSGRRMTKKEGRNLAIKIHQKRAEYDTHTAGLNGYVIHSAEGLAETKRFDYLMSICVLNNTNGNPYFSSLEEYENRKDEKAAWDAARKLAEMVYGSDFSEDFENNVMEIQFLKKFDYIDEKGNYIDPKTKERVDVDGNPIKKEELDTDAFGNKIKDGKAIVEFGDYADDEEEEVPVEKPKKEEKVEGKELEDAKLKQ